MLKNLYPCFLSSGLKYQGLCCFHAIIAASMEDNDLAGLNVFDKMSRN
jgi:hypothetical protein